MRVRLGFAVAAHLETEILIVDEVLAVGDYEFQSKAIGKMEYVSQNEGRTVLFVSHNLSNVRRLCNKGIVLDEGKLVFCGDIDDALEYYTKKSNKEKFNGLYKNLDCSHPFYVQSIKLISEDGKISNSFLCDESIVIRIECYSDYVINDLYCGISFMMNNQTILFCSSNDSNKTALYDFPKNKNIIDIKVPKNSLGHGEYIVNIQFTSHSSEKHVLFRLKEVINFSLSDISSNKKNKRDGYLSTILDWNVNNLQENK